MPQKADWKSLSHQKRVEVLAKGSDDEIAEKYRVAGKSNEQLKQLLAQERALWMPGDLGTFKTAGKPPTKDVVLGAWRDLQRSEALLELIDNSIDIWLARRSADAKQAAKELDIFITIDEKLSLLTYEDNAGGVPESKLVQLVVPGHSDTTDLSLTIGSYKTGGKKAVFRLATAAQILTRYWEPDGKSNNVVSVQLDEEWLSDPELYQFQYASVTNVDAIEKGHTRYVLRLHEEPLGATPWYKQPDLAGEIRTQIRETYTLLLIRNPDIHIYYLSTSQAIVPEPEALYDFSGASQNGIDIRPQQVIFESKLIHNGVKHPIEIEVILGCRRSVAAGKRGLDLYGNNRLFVACDEELFATRLPKGNAARLFRGLINIRGPNVFIPWDTHKRHLNIDRDITRFLTTNPLIVKVFDNWFSAYNKIGRGDVTSRINVALDKRVDAKKPDLFIPNRDTVRLDPDNKRGTLPKNVFVPEVSVSVARSSAVDLKLHFTRDEAKTIQRYYLVSGDVKDRATKLDLAAHIKEDVLKRAGRKPSR
jgi:hypothetical protein